MASEENSSLFLPPPPNADSDLSQKELGADLAREGELEPGVALIKTEYVGLLVDDCVSNYVGDVFLGLFFPTTLEKGLNILSLNHPLPRKGGVVRTRSGHELQK